MLPHPPTAKARRALALTSAILIGGLSLAAAAETSRTFSLRQSQDWSFFNGEWSEAEDGSLAIPKQLLRQDGPAMQGHHYAFFKPAAYGDVDAEFEIRLTAHSDAGLIFRAANPGQFYTLHFPNCGQASRVKNFWVALSRMDEDGYMRISKLDLVRRVPSDVGIWLPVSVSVRGDRVRVRIGDSGYFEAADGLYRGPGRVGLYLFRDAAIRNVRINGQEVSPGAWDEKMAPRRNWFHPVAGGGFPGWQRPLELVRTPKGDLLLNYTTWHERKATSVLVRSKDNGRTWSQPQENTSVKPGQWEGQAAIHVFPDGKLRMMHRTKEGIRISETTDDGHTWTQAKPVLTKPLPSGLKSGMHWGPHIFMNLQDGSTIMFGYDSHDSSVGDHNVWQWGATHAQAFAARSTDNGASWSEWVNLDNPGKSPASGEQVDGSFDFTEVSGVQTADGKILALVRPVYSPWMWEAVSRNGGKSWEPARLGPFPGYATPNMLRTKSGAILVAHRLPGLTIHLSLDDGRTFDQGTMIDSAVWAMGHMAEVEPDLVLYVYWDSFESRMRAQFIRVTPTGLIPVKP